MFVSTQIIVLRSEKRLTHHKYHLLYFLLCVYFFEMVFLDILYFMYSKIVLKRTFVSYNHQLTYLWMCGFGCYILKRIKGRSWSLDG